MVFINKAVLIQYNHSITLLTLQMAVTAALIILGRNFQLVRARPFDLPTAWRLIPLSMSYNANVAFALASLKGINIPMYIALKRLTPMAVLIAGLFYKKDRPPLQVTLSVSLTVVGCVIAAVGDFSFEPMAYAMALTSVFFQTAYLVLVERSGAESGLTSTELMLYNSVLSLPVLLLFLLLSGDTMPSLLELVEEGTKSVVFAVVVLLSLLMGIALNFTMFLCTIVNSALTTTIVGVLKGVGSTILGFFILGGVEFHWVNVAGLVINTAGGVWYSVAKYRIQQLKRRQQQQQSEKLKLEQSLGGLQTEASENEMGQDSDPLLRRGVAAEGKGSLGDVELGKSE
eukprot:TRINITY_DN2017_c0_g1_i1.p1 TRINITY_DN2017_c0_g1~~TRINITY_DN2017_c0_g1_i1.p1  ORF type:complete len:366 (-),score=108.74 TRINITY_DN2017_c0_g1_i1:212-1240(-)